MTDENESQKRLTLEDPVDPEVLTHLEVLHNHWMDLAERNARLDQEKIQILAALKRLDDEKQKVFEAVQVERGISPTKMVSIDPKTRCVKILNPDQPPQADAKDPSE